MNDHLMQIKNILRTIKEIDEDIAMDMNQTDDYDDSDPWGEETENNEDYY